MSENPTPINDLVTLSRPSSPAFPTAQVGFIGLGNMGFFMARNLAQHAPQSAEDAPCPPLLVWNRSENKSQQLLDIVGPAKVRIATDPEHIANECDIIIVNLANDDVVKTIYQRLSDALKKSPPTKNKVFVETSTIFPSLAGELDALISSSPHARLITCPVLGPPAVADKRQLLLAMSGDYRSKKEVTYLLVPAVGRKVVDLGGDLEQAPTYKLIFNSIILGHLEVLAEAFTMAEKSGVGAGNIHDLIQDYFPAPIILNYAERFAKENFDGSSGFSIDGGIKDATHIRRLTANHDCPMPNIDAAYQHLLSARAIHARQMKEGSATVQKLDWSGIIAGTRVAAGMHPFERRQNDSGTVEEE